MKQETRGLRVLMRTFVLLLAMLPIGLQAGAASKPPVVSLGKAVPVKLFIGPSEDKTMGITVRPLYVDTKLKDFTTGDAHEVTDREYVIQRAYRINDSLPEDQRKTPRWFWQRGGWLLVDRVSGRISLVKLPDLTRSTRSELVSRLRCRFVASHPMAERANAVVAEIGGRKALFRKGRAKSTWPIAATVIAPLRVGSGRPCDVFCRRVATSLQ